MVNMIVTKGNVQKFSLIVWLQNMVLDELTNSFANRPTKHSILAILTAKNKAANLSLDDSKKREWLFHFSLNFNIRTLLYGCNMKKTAIFDVESSIY